MSPPNRALRRAATAAAVSFLIALSGCAYTAPTPTPTQIPIPTSDGAASTDSLDLQAQLFMRDGAVATVVQVRWPGGQWSKAYGVRALDRRAPATPGDRVQVANVTETMTAVAVFKLVDDGLIGLDDPVNNVIPDFTATLHPPRTITVRELLGHTSGMPEYTDALYRDVDVRPALTQTVSPQQALQLAGTRTWDTFDSGIFNYPTSNTEYDALGLLVQTLRHRPFADVLRDEVLNPVGLRHTTLDRVDVGESDLLHGYITLGNQELDTTDNPNTAGSPALGATTTMGDLNDFLAALFGGRLISAKSVAEMKKSTGTPYSLGAYTAPDHCTGGLRYEAKGRSWGYLTLAVSSDDGRYLASMTVVPAPLPTQIEDRSTDTTRDLILGQMESTLNETLDRICRP